MAGEQAGGRAGRTLARTFLYRCVATRTRRCVRKQRAHAVTVSTAASGDKASGRVNVAAVAVAAAVAATVAAAVARARTDKAGRLFSKVADAAFFAAATSVVASASSLLATRGCRRRRGVAV